MEDDNGIALLDKAETMSNGGTWEKILAINLLMDHFIGHCLQKKLKSSHKVGKEESAHRCSISYCNKTTKGVRHR